jgi:benzoylformate decarboxylase
LKELRDAIAIGAGATYQKQVAARNEAFRAARDKETAAFDAYLAAHAGDVPMAPVTALREIAQALPAGAIIVDEAITSMHDLAQVFTLEQAGDFYAGRGGGIGQGVAGALGVAVANPDRLVVALSGDGSAMYSIQALWTAAHHELNVLFVILSNREYRILKHNLDTYRQRFDMPADRPYPHMDLNEPTLGFADMARGMGVNGREVSGPEDLKSALAEALATKGPYLIDVVVAGK